MLMNTAMAMYGGTVERRAVEYVSAHKWGARITARLAVAAFFAAALPATAAETSTWQGGASGIWGAGYESNWNVYPDSTRYAQFAAPANEPITVEVVGSVDAYGIQNSSSRTAGLNFTGSGTINNYRGTLFSASSAPSLTDWNVDVASWYGGYNANIEGTNIFRKGWSSTNEYVNTKANARVVLCESARMSALHVKIAADSSFEMKDTSTATFAKDLRVEPGATFSIADGAVLTLRSLFLPFSPEEGVSDEWIMDGGEIRAVVPSSHQSMVYMPYTNATKTVSGRGTIFMTRFDCKDASNLVFRLNGPDMYVYDGYISSSNVGYLRTRFEIGGGSTLGVWGNDCTFERWTNRVVGAATIDTTDYADKTTPRTVTLSKLFDCSGELTAKGLGTLKLSGGILEYPNLSLVGKDSATISFTSAYALENITLHDSSKLTLSDYIGHKTQESYRNAKSLAMDGNSSLDVGRYVILTGDATLSGNASAVICNKHPDSGAIFTCANLSLSDNASLSVTGTISATSLAMSGSAHVAFTAGTSFAAGAAFGAGDWTMEITIPSGYEAGIRPVVIGAEFEGDFAEHVTLLGETTGWSARTLNGSLVLYKDAPASGIEWVGDSPTSDNWSDSANWNEGNVPTADDIVAFGGLDRLSPYNDSLGTVSGIVFRASAGPFVLSGSDDLALTATSGGRGSTTANNASIVSHSAFDQTIESFVNFGGVHAGVISDGGGALRLTGGFNASDNWKYFVLGGDVRIGGTCSIGIFSFKTSTAGKPTCLTLLPGCKFTIRNQYFRGLVESDNYLGRFVVEEGAELIVKDGDCVFWYGGLENVIDGTLSVKGDQDNGRLVGGPTEQYYVGKGAIYADSARSGRTAAAANHYIDIGGSLKLYMNGNWYTATYLDGGSEGVVQNPNYPTRFRMTDGTTLGATKDWTYGPRDNAYDKIDNAITPADRMSIMTGTVTVNTQSPKDGSAHTITFVDPLDASAATVVKTGAGTLAFNEPAGYQSQISNLTVNAGCVSFASAPTLSGTLTIPSNASEFQVDGLAETSAWTLLATATDIVGPDGEAKWSASKGMRRYKIVAEGAVKKLYGAKDSGLSIIIR